MHVYARFHCICPCPVPCKGCLGWHSFSLSCVVQDCLTNNDYELIWRALLCTWPVAPVAPVALPARLGTCVFLQEQWFGTRNHLQSLQSKGKHTSYHILSKCLSQCLIMFDIFMAVTASIPGMSWDENPSCRALTGKTTWPVVFAVNIWQVPQPWCNGCHQHPPAVSFLTVRSVSTICVVMIYQCWSWFGSAKYANAVNAHDLMIFDS